MLGVAPDGANAFFAWGTWGLLAVLTSEEATNRVFSFNPEAALAIRAAFAQAAWYARWPLAPIVHAGETLGTVRWHVQQAWTATEPVAALQTFHAGLVTFHWEMFTAFSFCLGSQQDA